MLQSLTSQVSGLVNYVIYIHTKKHGFKTVFKPNPMGFGVY